MPLLRLIRLPNLLVVALTQILVFYRVIVPALQATGLRPALSDWRLLELVAATCMVTAGGYIINDIYDTKIDAVNRPARQTLVTAALPLATWLYGCLVLGGFILSELIAMRLDELEWLWLYPTATVLLALYSPFFKRLPFIGNLLIGLYCAGVAGLLWLAERHALADLAQLRPDLALDVRHILLLFMVFAFVGTLLRELIKDIEDADGDRAHGRRTLPVVLGTSRARWLAAGISLLLLGSMSWPLLYQWPVFSAPLLQGTLLLLGLWLLVLLVQLFRARVPGDFHRLSTQLKFFMLGGMALLLLFQF